MGEQMEHAKERNKKHDSLYRGGKEASLFAVAPYIFQFSSPSSFSDWYLDHGWGDSWGILLKSSWPLPEMHKHFRRFLMVNTEDGQNLYFRFYDPRVLKIFLPTCDAQQLREFFGPIDYFLLEDEDPAYAIRYWHENGQLKMQKKRLEELVQRFAPPGAEADNKVPELVGVETMAGSSTATFVQPVAPANPKKEEFTRQPPLVKPEQSNNDEPPKPKTKWNMFD